MNVIHTDFGEVRVGPKFAALFASFEPDLAKRKNSTAYKTAQWSYDRVVKAIVLMHEACFQAGVDFGGTP